MSDENDFVPEEDSDEDEEGPAYIQEQETFEETKTLFERRIRERFIYGQLEVGLGVWRQGAEMLKYVYRI
jgi:hypothetical protein